MVIINFIRQIDSLRSVTYLELCDPMYIMDLFLRLPSVYKIILKSTVYFTTAR